jgi:hypothetical protein
LRRRETDTRGRRSFEFFAVIAIFRVALGIAHISTIFKNLAVASHGYPLRIFHPFGRVGGEDRPSGDTRIAFG